jgi:hypothetical protein
MTFKDLRKYLENNNITKSQNNVEERQEKIIKLNSQRFDIFRNKPFWIENIAKHKLEDIRTKGNCCFNHIIGLPKKDRIEHKIYDYEMQLVNALDNNKSVFVKKARGLGITELILRYMAYLAVKDDTYKNCRFHIITGPNIRLAEELVDRLHNLFVDGKLGIDCKQTGSILYLNGVTIQAFPSHHTSAARGYTNVKVFFVDEAAFFIKSEQEEVSAVVQAYRVKDDARIVLVSTPYKVNDLFYTIDQDVHSRFYKINLSYEVGVGKIYSPTEIEKEKNQSYFAREFCLKYNIGVGNVFLESSLQVAEQLGIKYRHTPHSNSNVKAMGLDEGFGSSATSFVVVEIIDNLVRVIHSEQVKHSSTNQMVQHAKDLMIRYNILDNEDNKVFIDASQPGFIRSLKYQIACEVVDYERVIEKARQRGHDDVVENQLHRYMRIVPVNFSTQGKRMLENLKKHIDQGKVAIDPEVHSELLADLRVAESDENLSLKKDQSATMDLLDAFRLAMKVIK